MGLVLAVEGNQLHGFCHLLDNWPGSLNDLRHTLTSHVSCSNKRPGRLFGRGAYAKIKQART